MFCPIVKVELNVESCPTRACIYKGVGGRCMHDVLTADTVDVSIVADVRQRKQYLVKAEANSAKQQVRLGMVIMQYANFVRDSYPDRTEKQTVNTKGEDSHVSRVLRYTFRLSTAQQEKFWDTERFKEWTARANLTVTLSDIRQAMLASSPV